MTPPYKCPPIKMSSSIRARMKLIRDEGYNRLGLARFVRRRGWDFGQAESLETLARGMFTALSRAILTMRGLPPQRPSPSPEVRRTVSFIVYGERK